MHVIVLTLLSYLLLGASDFLEETNSYQSFAPQNQLFDASAAGITLPLFELSLAQKNACGFFRVADQEKPGVFFITFKNQKCKKSFLEKRVFETKGIFNFKFLFKQDRLILFLDKKKIEIPMPNLIKSNPKLFRGPQQSFVKIGSTDKSLMKADGQICLKIEDDCSEGLNSCSRCKNSSYSIIASGCFRKYSRICGINNCGLKGEPACVRGAVYPHIQVKNFCQNGSPYGFCQQGSEVICENGTLVCN